MSKVVNSLTKQRRFKILLTLLIFLGFLLGVIIVPVERAMPDAPIQTFGDGMWWAVTTITSVGYGDLYPVSGLGRLIGMVLQVVGVVAFGLLIGLMTVALSEAKERFYWNRVMNRLDKIESQLEAAQKREQFVVKHNLADQEE